MTDTIIMEATNRVRESAEQEPQPAPVISTNVDKDGFSTENVNVEGSTTLKHGDVVALPNLIAHIGGNSATFGDFTKITKMVLGLTKNPEVEEYTLKLTITNATSKRPQINVDVTGTLVGMITTYFANAEEG